MSMPDRGYFRMDLTDNCNIRCIMCQAYNWMPVNTMRFIDFDRFVAATRGEIGKWQVIQVGNVAEATIHPRFADFIRYIRREAPDSQIRLVTNGRLLHKFAPLLNEAGNVVVQVSMDSIRKQTHEYIRAGSDYERAIHNISLVDLKRNQVVLAFTLMAANIDEYAEMVQFCQERGYQMGVFPMIVRTEAGILPLNLLRESLWFHIGKLQAWLKEYYGVQYGMMVGTAAGAIAPVADFECNAHMSDANLDAVGNMNLCGKLGLGTLVLSSLQELWNSDPALRFREEVENGRGPCMTCNYRQRCLSPSMALLDNHFSEAIVRTIPEQTKREIAYDRRISDEEAMVSFIAGIHDNIGLFDIRQTPDGFTGQQVIAHDGKLFFSDPISTSTRHELHARMREISATDLDPTLVAEGVNGYNIVKFSGWFWALPQSLGHVNLSQEADQRKPGIMKRRTLTEAKDLCFNALVTLSAVS